MDPAMVGLLEEDVHKGIWVLVKLGLCIINNSFLNLSDFEP